jgi:hypothetical protein
MIFICFGLGFLLPSLPSSVLSVAVFFTVGAVAFAIVIVPFSLSLFIGLAFIYRRTITGSSPRYFACFS